MSSNTSLQRQTSSQHQRQNSSAEQTTMVVEKLKCIVQRESNPEKMKKSSIEENVFNIRVKEQLTRDDLRNCRESLPDNFKDCSDRTLKQALAYGGDSPNFLKILGEKFNNSDPADSLLLKNTSTLQKLRQDLKKDESPFNLFVAVLNINDNEINRADRMFYSEAHRLVKNLRDYTFDNAHDQVQAIRLTHYQSNDTYEIQDLIEKHRTFDEAYSYLRHLAKKQLSNQNDIERSIVSTGNSQSNNYSNSSTSPSLINSASRNSRPPSGRQDQGAYN